MVQVVDEKPARSPGIHRLLHPLSTARVLGPGAIAHAVHGLVLFVAIVGATYVADYPGWKMLLFSVGSVVLFWIAHVYAAVLAAQHTPDDADSVDLRTVAREARRAVPLLQACIAPAVPLLLATLRVLPLPVAYASSVTIAVATLAAVGFVALRNRRASLRQSLLSAAATGGFGAAIIAAETFWH